MTNVIGTVWVPRDASREERIAIATERLRLDPRVTDDAVIGVRRSKALATTAGGDVLKIFIKEKP